MSTGLTDVQIQAKANGVREIALALQKIADSRSFIKDVKDTLKQQGIDIKNINKLAKHYKEQNLQKLIEDTEILESEYIELSL